MDILIIADIIQLKLANFLVVNKILGQPLQLTINDILGLMDYGINLYHQA